MQQNVTCNHCLHEKTKKKSAVNDKMTFSLLSQKQIMKFLQSKWHLYFYTPDVRSMWGHIVFAFPFVCSSVRTYVRSYVRSFVRVSVTGSKFLR